MNKSNLRQKKRSGESPKNILLPVTESAGLMEFLELKMPHKSRNNIKSLLVHKQVLVNGEVISQYNHPLIPGQKVEISRERIPAEKKFREYTIVHEDNDLIVIDKRAGLLSVATDNEKQVTAFNMLSNHVKRQNEKNKIFVVHRLDRETSGLILFAKNESIKQLLQESWNETIIKRTYIAVVEGEMTDHEGVIFSYLTEGSNYRMISSPEPGNGQKAVTHFTTLKKNKQFSLLKVNLETGRKNQIRVHMQVLGHPVAGDKKYGAKTNPMKRLGLHAQSLSFIHPSSGQNMDFETNIPRVFNRLF